MLLIINLQLGKPCKVYYVGFMCGWALGWNRVWLVADFYRLGLGRRGFCKWIVGRRSWQLVVYLSEQYKLVHCHHEAFLLVQYMHVIYISQIEAHISTDKELLPK